MTEPTDASATRAAKSTRRAIYVRERLPAVVAEMKSLSEERNELLEKRKRAPEDERKQMNRRWSFVTERLEVLRGERAALIGERDGLRPQVPKA